MPRIFQKARDPISSYSHFIGAALSLIGLVAMAIQLALTPGQNPLNAVSCILFCLSLIALYSASGIYHFSRAAANVLVVLRKLDHAMIYVLIAGTYTPLLLGLLPAPRAEVFTALAWHHIIPSAWMGYRNRPAGARRAACSCCRAARGRRTALYRRRPDLYD